MSSPGWAAPYASLCSVLVLVAGCGRIDYDPNRGGPLDAAVTARDGGGLDGRAADAERPDAGRDDAGSHDAFDGLQSCTTSTDCASGSCWGRWCVAPCSAGCGKGFECLTLPSSSFAYCLPRCDRAPAGCPAEAPCNGTVCEPTCDTGGACPGSTFCMVDTCSGD